MILYTRALALLVLVLTLAACGGEEAPSTGITAVGDLRGGTIGVASIEDTATLELRFVLQESYGLIAGSDSTDVTLVELPASELVSQLSQGEIDAALIPPGTALAEFDEAEFRILSHVTQEMSDVTGLPVTASLLLTYADIAEQKMPGLSELNRMLTESMTYLQGNHDDVVSTVSAEQEVDEDGARSWWDVLDLLFGDTSAELQEQITSIWSAALALGDIIEVPLVEELMLFGADGDAPDVDVTDDAEEPDAGDRAMISIGVLDDASRRAALFAIEQGIVASETIDLSITYLARSELSDAVTARQFDVIEASPLAVPLGVERELEFVIVSGAVQNTDGTLLVVLIR